VRDFFDTTDAEIVETIAVENGLIPAPDAGLDQRYDHVYQHNQTDLEFLLERAKRIGYEVLVDDTRLLFRKPEPPPPVVVAPRPRAGGTRLRRFHPRLSSSNTVQQVVVRGGDPEQHEFVGKASEPTILLTPGDPDPDAVLGQTLDFTVDSPIFSVEEANAIAKSKLGELAMTYLTSEAESAGNPALRPGIEVALAGLDDRFDGRYLVVGTSHRYAHGQLCGGYKTFLKLRRSAGLFFLPEIDDEVLLAFEGGDISRPVIVGSLWDEDDGCTTGRPLNEE
jgi:phage protein D